MKEKGSTMAGRRAGFLQSLGARDLSGDMYGGLALAHLAAGVHTTQANAQLRRVAAWFELPHPTGRDPQGEADFCAIKLCWAYYRFGERGQLEPETLRVIREYFLRYDFQSKYVSENHRLLFHASRYLMACAYEEDVFGRYGLTGSQLRGLEREYLLDFLRFRARQGWEEFDSGCYLAPGWEALCALRDFAPDGDLRQLAEMMMNVRLMDMIADSLEGMYCGAHGRIYERHALDHRGECTYFLQALYFGNVECLPLDQAGAPYIVEALLSDFAPEPLLSEVLAGRTYPYENRERTHLHCSTYLAPQRPLNQEPGSIHKITRLERGYALGAVQWQDPYPEGSLAAWYAGHQQHNWDLTFAGGEPRRRVFTHHPGQNGAEGAEHGYWTGDMFCCCSCHFQQGTAVLSLYDIGPEEPFQWIHAHLPRALFDQIEEQGNSIYLRQGGVYAMLCFARPYRWTTEGPWAGLEVISEGAKNAAVCEVGTGESHGGFEAFCAEMEQNTLTLDAAAGTLRYVSRRNGDCLLARGRRERDGEALSFDYATYDSPYMRADWDSGLITISLGEKKLVYDFEKIETARADV